MSACSTHSFERKLTKYLKGKDLTSLKVIVASVRKENRLNISNGDIERNKKGLEEFISRRFLSDKGLLYSTYEVAIEYFDDILKNSFSDNDFSFLDSNDQSILMCVYSHLINDTTLNFNYGLRPITSTSEIKDQVIYYFIESTESMSNKKKYLEMLHSHYIKSNKIFNFKWLDAKDMEQASWSIKYLTDSIFINNALNEIPDIVFQKNEFTITIPGLFHSIYGIDAEKTLFFIKMKKAWDQVKYRKKIKSKNKTTINLVISQESKDNLKSISEFYELNLNETFERIISEEARMIKDIPT